MEILFWLAILVLNIFFAARIIRKMRSRAYQDAVLTEAFERYRRARHESSKDLIPEEFSYARERLSREDDWAA